MASVPFSFIAFYLRICNRLIKAILTLLLLCLVSGCAPVIIGTGTVVGNGRLAEDAFMAADGVTLPLSRWSAEDPKAVVLALHGFNDYRRFFGVAAEYLQKRGIVSYAYDQRGFGASSNIGIWAGTEAYVDDLTQLTALIRERHPGLPVYLLGESMGGAVIVEAMTRPEKPRAEGIILAAPAVWGWETMPWYQTSLLWMLSHTVPWLTLTGEGLNLTPSDNIEMLKALGRDPLVIKGTRVDALYGLTDLMNQALVSAEKLGANTLLLYGENDEIIRPEPTKRFIRDLLAHQAADKTIAYYRHGYHMLLRDLQAPVIWEDIAHWILHAGTPLPSGADQYGCKLVAHDNACDEKNTAGLGVIETRGSEGRLANATRP